MLARGLICNTQYHKLMLQYNQLYLTLYKLEISRLGAIRSSIMTDK